MEQGNKFESKTDQVWSSPRLIQLGAAVNSRGGIVYYQNEASTTTNYGGMIYYGPSGGLP